MPHSACAAREEDGTEPVAAEEQKQRDGTQRREIERAHRPEQEIGRLRGTAGRKTARQQILVRHDGFDRKGNRPGEEGERKRHGQHDDEIPPALRRARHGRGLDEFGMAARLRVQAPDRHAAQRPSRAMVPVVLKPGTMSTISTRPPFACTKSAPTISETL